MDTTVDNPMEEVEIDVGGWQLHADGYTKMPTYCFYVELGEPVLLCLTECCSLLRLHDYSNDLAFVTDEEVEEHLMGLMESQHHL